MTTLSTQGISLYYEVHGNPDNPAVLLLSGLAGTGKSWNTQIERFAAEHYVVVPDQRGTGQTTRSEEGYSTEQLGIDMASLVEQLGVGPVHVVGASTGGAIGQHMALDHPHTVRTLTLVASFARFDAFMQREFQARRHMAAEWDRTALLSAYSVFLFSPRYARHHPEKVTAWVQRAGAQPTQPQDVDISLKRIDMIAAHDTLPRLHQLRQPTLVLCGEHDFCTPLPHSQELADGIADSELVVPDCGHFVEHELEEDFFQIVAAFIKNHN
ncbi:alpha/beta fold hydrolase [Mycobacterium sp.]|uniref:alpha/beta fold hydrolase n=1 Tax=Mycobacterium sp. TaxID=1785 RepID=UPI003C743FBD